MQTQWRFNIVFLPLALNIKYTAMLRLGDTWGNKWEGEERSEINTLPDIKQVTMLACKHTYNTKSAQFVHLSIHALASCQHHEP